MWRLVQEPEAEDTQNSGLKITLSPGGNTVGRCRSCTHLVTENYTSRVHARLTVDGSQHVTLEDLISKHGTWISSDIVAVAGYLSSVPWKHVPASDPVNIRSGTLIRLGPKNTSMIFRLEFTDETVC